MNFRFPIFAAAALALISTTATQAQDVSTEVKVDIKNVSVQGQSTPDFSVNYTKPKRWRSKEWMEVEVTFQVDKKKVPGENNPVVNALEFKFFIGLNKTNKDGKFLMLTGAASFVDAIERSDNVAMMFTSPAALVGLLQKNGFTSADVKAWGVEVYYAGAVAGWKSSTSGRWWIDGAATLETIDGKLLPKAKTPFAPLWGDYDLESKQ
jgi:hypothetical protein